MVRFFIIIVLTYSFNSVSCQQDSIEEIGFPFEEVPIFDGDLRTFVQKNIVYPESAITDSIEGKVYVRYLIDTLGFTKRHVVEKGVRYDLNEEAIRVAKLVKYDSPAKQGGKSVLFLYTLPIEFKLPPRQDELPKDGCKK